MFSKKPVTNYEYVQIEMKQDPPGHVKLCGHLTSFPMVRVILGDELWDYSVDEMLNMMELTITHKENQPKMSLQLLKMAIIRLYQDDDFTIMPNSMYGVNGREKLMMYKEVTKEQLTEKCLIA